MSCGEEFTVEEFIRDLPGYHGLVVARNHILSVDERPAVEVTVEVVAQPAEAEQLVDTSANAAA